MPTELEELVDFLHHGNTQVRQIAAENLVGYSAVQPEIFKTGQLTPVKDLKLLIKDYPEIAKNALTILVNIAADGEILKGLAEDDAFLEAMLLRMTNDKEQNADEMAMLLANIAKSDTITRLLKQKRKDVPKHLSTSSNAMDQIMDCFVKGAERRYNKHADYDYLSYFFADMAKHADGRQYFVTPRKDDNDIIPLTKLIVFTEHKSVVRRRGVASAMKNVAFDVPSHSRLTSSSDVNILPYLLLPLMGSEDYTDEDTEGMLEECQLLPPDKERESDAQILSIHLETLLLLTTNRKGRDVLRGIKTYPIVRELHLKVDDEGVREGCDRLVQVLMREEEGENKVEEIDEDEQIIEVL